MKAKSNLAGNENNRRSKRRSAPEHLESRLCLTAPAEFIADLNTRPVSAQASHFLPAEDFTYFVAHDALHGRELWRTDGTTEGTVLVKDIRPGPGSSNLNLRQPTGFGNRNGLYEGAKAAILGGNTLVFVADDGQHGAELWRSDGTTEGTVLIRDLSDVESVNGPYYYGSQGPAWLTKHANEIYFAARTPELGRELWKTDGTAVGTVLVKDILAGVGASNPSQILDFHDQLLFTANDGQHGNELWISDGTSEGTRQVSDNNPTGDGVSFFCGHQSCQFPLTLHPTLGKAVFTGMDGTTTTLWITDGTNEGTFPLKDSSTYSPQVSPLENKLVFTSWDGGSWNLWSSDGTRDGLTLLREFGQDAWLFSPVASDNRAYFGVSGQTTGIWQTDGTPEGTFAVPNTGRHEYAAPKAIVDDTLFFTSNSGGTSTLRKVDASGDQLVSRVDYIRWVEPIGNKLAFATGDEIWITDAESTKTEQIHVGRNSGYYPSRLSHQGQLFFAGENGQLWTSDLTKDGTAQLSDIPISTHDSSPTAFVRFMDKHYFIARRENSRSLFEHDPETGTTRPIRTADVVSDRFGDDDSLRVFGDRLLFVNNSRLWYFDGDRARQLLRTNGVFDFEVIGDSLYFSAYGTTNSLYKSDGTDRGTERLLRGHTNQLTVSGDTLFFSSSDDRGGQQLWKSDGTKEGTKPVSSAFTNSDFREIAPSNTGVFYVINRWDSRGPRVAVWHSDGSREGSELLIESLNNTFAYQERMIKSLGDQAIVAFDDGERGKELWVSDGTAEGTRPMDDLDRREHASGSAPTNFVSAGNASYFTALGSDGLRSVWRVPHDDPQQAHVVKGGFFAVNSLTAFGNRALFTASRPSGAPITYITNDDGDDATLLHPTQANEFAVQGDHVYFTAQRQLGDTAELYVSDGSRSENRKLTTNGQPNSLTVVGDTLYFVAATKENGRELWSSQGTEASTQMILDINPGPEPTNLSDLTALGSKLLFVASSTQSGRELWISDGTKDGTHVVADVRNEITKDSSADQFAHVGDWTYFVADDGIHGRELWRTDGTAAGTTLFEDRIAGQQSPRINHLTPVGDALFFTSTNEHHTDELIVITGPDIDSQRVLRSGSNRRLILPSDLTVYKDTLYFVAQETTRGKRRLYGVDMSTGGTSAELIFQSQEISDLIVVGDRLFFVADDGTRGRELWQTDGTEQGTDIVLDIFDALTVASKPADFVRVGDRVFFTAHDQSHGTELWSTDGTVAGTQLVADVVEGSGSGDPRELTEFNGELIFSATGRPGQKGRELWISDGTSAGTRTVRRDPIQFPNNPIYPVDPSSITVAGESFFFFAAPPDRNTELWKSDGTHAGTKWISTFSITDGGFVAGDELMVAAGESVYFAAANGDTGRELWTSDGTTTRVVKDISDGSSSSISRDEREHKLVPHGDSVFFAADSDANDLAEIWITDGTEEGTRVVHHPRGRIGAFPLDVADGWLYFSSPAPQSAGNELWKTDGTIANTSFVADLTVGEASTNFFPHGKFTELRSGEFLFPAVTQVHGSELWVTDGTEAGTRVLDLESGTGSTRFGDLVQIEVIDEVAYFFASSPSRGTGLWKSDGTIDGTELVQRADITPWPDLTLINGRLYYGSSDPTGHLAISDGAVQNIRMTAPIPKGSSDPDQFEVVGDQLYFVADDGEWGREIWQTDGTAGGTRRVSDLLAGLKSADPEEITAIGEQFFFSAADPDRGRELWTMTPDGEASLVRDISPGNANANPTSLTNWAGQLVFEVTDSDKNSALWISDGSEENTRPLFDDSQPLHAPNVAGVHNDQLFVVASSPTEEHWLYRLDTPTSAPVRIAPIEPGATPQIVGDQFHFSGFEAATGYEPWVSDGTAEGSQRMADVNQSTFGANPELLRVLNGTAYFTADNSQGRSLWQSDGTEAGTSRLSSVLPDLPQAETADLVTTANVLFVRQSSDFGIELWRVDPRDATAESVWRDSEQQEFGAILGVAGDQLFFTASQPNTGTELWASDSTGKNAQQVSDVNPGAASSTIDNWTAFHDGHLFTAQTESHGNELWFTDGTEAGTRRISDAASGPANSGVNSVQAAGDHILFVANDGTHGSEPWISDGTEQGTRMLVNIDQRTRGSDPTWITPAGDNVFFVATDEDGEHLWRWNSSMESPHRVEADIQSATELRAAGNVIYFSAYEPDSGEELWVSDGTARGTRLISDVAAGPESSAPKKISITDRGDILFSAVDAAHGREAWWLPALEGDTDADRDVDFDDFLTVAENFGQPGTQSEGDFNRDGTIDFKDFLLLAKNFGRIA